jgi:hypothetical protein
MAKAVKDVANPRDWPERFSPMTCPAGCASCWYDKWAGQCIYRGPFKGYYNQEGQYVKFTDIEEEVRASRPRSHQIPTTK